MSIIRFEAVDKYYDSKVQVLKNVNLAFEKGRFYFLTGATGSGKTTILKLIHLLEQPSSGKIYFNDQLLSKKTKLSRHRAAIGYVFQDHRLLEEQSVSSNIALPLHINGYRTKLVNERIATLALQLGIKPLLKKPLNCLSGGEKQLVAIARAISTKPQVLLIDEPSAHLDRQTAMKILSILLNIQNTGVTILLATHDLELMRATGKADIVLIENKNANFWHPTSTI